MPSHAFSEAPVDPASIVDELLGWLCSAGFHGILGIALGVLAARAMRARHLHWSWAAGVLAVTALARPLHGGWMLTLASASLLASARGRRWHREDLDAGADLAELAARRTGPLDLVRWLALALAARAGGPERIGAARRLHAQELLVGHDEGHRRVSIPLGGETGGTHALVVGATGSGKTVTQTWIAVRAIERGMGAIVLDPKGDGGMREALRMSALAAGRSFLEWTPDGQRVYNPYASGGASEIADKVLAGERFTEPHYLRQAQRYLGHVVRALRATGSQVSLSAIVEHLEPARLELLVRELPESDARATFRYLDSLSPRQQSELAGVRDRLAILAESDLGTWLDPQTTRRPGVRSARRSRQPGGRVLQPRIGQPAAVERDARRRDRAGPPDDRRGIAAKPAADAGRHRRVLRDRGRAGRQAVRPGAICRVQPPAGHAGALRPQARWA